MRPLLMISVLVSGFAACATSGSESDGYGEEDSEVRRKCPSGPDVDYVSRKQNVCATVRFACAEGMVPFNDRCGCGCMPAPASCVVTGCSGQLCADQDMITTCEWRDEYACYATATCERQADGQCGWTQTAELQTCIDESQGDGSSVPL